MPCGPGGLELGLRSTALISQKSALVQSALSDYWLFLLMTQRCMYWGLRLSHSSIIVILSTDTIETIETMISLHVLIVFYAHVFFWNDSTNEADKVYIECS